MAVKKLGKSTSITYGLKSAATGQYITAQAWDYLPSSNPKDCYKIRELDLKSYPAMIGKTEDHARKMLAMVPAKLMELIDEYEGHIQQHQGDLANANPANEYAINWWKSQVEQYEYLRNEIISIMNAPINVVKITTVTDKTEIILP